MVVLIRIATRKSPLAVWQAEYVARKLKSAHPGVRTELVKLSTHGDEVTDRPLWRVGGKALFVRTLEKALLDGNADIAVHSMKDVPTTLPENLRIAAILPRADPADAFISTRYSDLSQLPADAVIGTTSPRRRSQLLHWHPRLNIRVLRGNVASRLAKLDNGDYDAIVLACAGLTRLNYAERITARLEPDRMLPAIGQGAIGIECRGDDTKTKHLLAPINHEATDTCVRAERICGQALGADCYSPVAAYAECDNSAIRMSALVASPDGDDIIRAKVEQSTPRAAGQAAAEQLLSQGASRLLAMAPNRTGK